MKTRSWLILGFFLVLAAAVAVALLREVERDEKEIATSISGVVEVAPELMAQGVADIVRTDRLVLMLVDPATKRPVALHFESPLVPPQTIRIGQADARGDAKLSGSYLLVGITDKDGEIFKVSPGEVYGRSPEPVALGSEEVRLRLTEAFRGSLFNDAAAPAVGPAAGAAGAPAGGGAPMMGATDADPRYSISGTITVKSGLEGTVAPSDRLIILMFDPVQQRPAAFKIIPHTLLPQQFTITLPPEARADAKPGYFLRVLTDKNDNPFASAPGELIGRSTEPVSLGTKELHFELDQPYTR